MGEIDQLKNRINNSGNKGIKNDHIREDYDPAGDMMLRMLTDSGDYVQRKTPANSWNQEWRIFKKGNEPY